MNHDAEKQAFLNTIDIRHESYIVFQVSHTHTKRRAAANDTPQKGLAVY